MRSQLSIKVLIKRGMLSYSTDTGYTYHDEICVYNHKNFKAICSGTAVRFCPRFLEKAPKYVAQ